LPGSNQFVNYGSKFTATHYLKNNSSVSVYEDETGTIWLCNQLDVLYRVKANMELEPLKINLPAFPFYDQQMMGYENIFRDYQNKEWAFKGNRIYSLNKVTKQLTQTFDFSATLKVNILKMIPDSNGHFWVATWSGGVLQFRPEENVLESVKAFPKRIITDITEWKYKKQQWLMAIEVNFGLYLFNNKTGASKNYGFIPGDPSGIQGNNFFQSYVDTKGNVWIGSNSGINKITAEQNVFDIFPVTDPGTIHYDLLKNGSVSSFLETDSSLWLSKRFVSTFEYDKNFKLKHFYKSFSPVSSTVSSRNGYAYNFFQNTRELFISTDSGLLVYNLQNKSTALFFPEPYTNDISLRNIVSFSKNELMIRSYEKGLFIFNTLQKKFTWRYSPNPNYKACLPSRLNYLFKTKRNEIFVSAADGNESLFKYQPLLDSFISVKALNDSSYSMQASKLFGMDEDGEGNLWITSSAGLFVYNPTSNLILQQVVKNQQIGGLYRICFDTAGNVWTNGNSGIWCYVKTTHQWIGFNAEDGLPGSQFEGIIARKSNGDIIAGLEGAIAIFHPKQLFKEQQEPSAIITDAATDNLSFSFPLLYGVKKILTLQPEQNSFSVDFALLNYVNPAAGKYYYKLAPLMKDFQLNDNGHINFNGLSPGTYTLHVKGGNKAGIIFIKEDLLTIEVLPHWYQTLWFEILCILSAALLLFLAVRWRIGSIKKQAGLHQKIAETEMQALRAQMNPHFIFNCLNSIENFIMQNKKRLASDYLNKFSRLIRIILESSSEELVPISKDMEALQLYIELEQLRYNNKFTFQFHFDEEPQNGDYKVPPLLIQPFVENAIIHGIAHSEKENNNITISVSLQDDYVFYIIEDNGIGRKKAGDYNLFNKPNHKSMGLTITAERIKLYNTNSGKSNIKITDLSNPQNEATGTRVEVKIKIK
jgi:ligand-binding sensor domain-containing protein